MKFAQRILAVNPSMTLAIDATARELKARGEDVIGFGAGEPDFDTPDHIKQAAIEALNKNDTHYTPVGGTPALKNAIIHKLKSEQGLEYSQDQILVSCGAKHTFYNLAQVLWEPGDEVIIPAPYWVSFPEMVGLSGAKAVIVQGLEPNDFKMTPDQLRSAITPKTRAVLINSPSNPTGSAYTRSELEALAECALKHRLLILSDEIYDKIVFDGFEHVSIASLDKEVQDNCVVINGASKGYAMTGWRIGYMAGNAEIIKQATKFQGQSTSNPCSISQAATIAALMGPQEPVRMMVEEFQRRRDIIVQGLSSIPGVTCYKPVGAFYAFPNFSALYGKSWSKGKIQGSLDFADFLLKEAKIALVPGIAFGADENARMSFAASVETIQKGVDRISKAVHSLID
jgi:aspartate aminotransferase